MTSKGKNNTFWKPGMIISVAMFVVFASLVAVYVLKPEIIGSKFTSSERPAIEKWITILAVDGEPVKGIKYVKGGYPFFCYSDKGSFSLKGHRQAKLPSGTIYISEYLLKSPQGDMLLKAYQGRNIKRIIEPREKIKGAVVKYFNDKAPKTTVRYLQKDGAPYEYAFTFNKNSADIMVYAQSPVEIKDLERLAGNLGAIDLCD